MTFVQVFDRSMADFIESKSADLGNGDDGTPTLGRHNFPEQASSGGRRQVFGVFDVNEPHWQGLAPGGNGFYTLVHEIGHGLGLSHPHDDGLVFPGVTNSGDLGDFNLNQGIFTMMSYNDRWTGLPSGVNIGQTFGRVGGPMAFDIAALQALYGAPNPSFTDDTYTLPDANDVGTFYRCIWDASGFDRIVYNGSRNTVMDLRSATLDSSTSGGGFPSFARGIAGGFTIASGVAIEAALGGRGNDVIFGNAGANFLTGNAGNDTVWGGAGDDLLFGGPGADWHEGEAGLDGVDYRNAAGGLLADLLTPAFNTGEAAGDRYFSIENLAGSFFGDNLRGDNSSNIINGGGGGAADRLNGRGGNDTLVGNDGNDTLEGGPGADVMAGGADDDWYRVDGVADQVIEADGEGFDRVVSDVDGYTLLDHVEFLRLGGSADLDASGSGGANWLVGNEGANALAGMGGDDR
ncbi:MAG TPA: M10 family metallopeptidase C-terminal domain-containing protein, partial [Thermomicrobiales bacterium]|nr:M10 family metallopeptidase C-terminal domain-containing protein [Thermomicrobiales bacterium]